MKHRSTTHILLNLLTLTGLLVLSQSAFAGQVTLLWDRNDAADGVVGYKVYHRPSPGAYRLPIDVGSDNTLTLANLAVGGLYCFAVTAYNRAGNESSKSQEVCGIASQTWAIAGTGDFNGDGKPDILWRNRVTGQNTVWFMGGANGTTLLNWAWLPDVLDTHWDLAGTGDFNRDGEPDILWRNRVTGQNTVWFMGGANGTTLLNWAWLPDVLDTQWALVSTRDFDGDGKVDLVWRNRVDGSSTVWLMNGAAIRDWTWLTGPADPDWVIADAAFFSGDGSPDILWRNRVTGQNMVWFMDGVAMTYWEWLPLVVDSL